MEYYRRWVRWKESLKKGINSIVPRGYRLFFRVEGENWGRKNGKIDGAWIFRDDKYNFYQLTFREGELLRKAGMPIYNEPQVLRIDIDSIREERAKELVMPEWK